MTVVSYVGHVTSLESRRGLVFLEQDEDEDEQRLMAT